MVSIDKRQFQRFPISFRASLLFKDAEGNTQRVDFTTKNISAGGLFFKPTTHINLNTKTTIELIMSVPDHYDTTTHNEIASTTGTVIRHESGGIAIQFDRELIEVEHNLRLINIHSYSNNKATLDQRNYFSAITLTASGQIYTC